MRRMPTEGLRKRTVDYFYSHKFSVWKLVKAVLARSLFILHSLLAIWKVAVVYEDRSYWFLAVMLFLIVAEGFTTIYFRGGDETVW